MFGIGIPELLLILVIALIVIGPKKLPDLAKSLGKALGEFKKATSDLKDSLEIDTDFKEVKDTFSEVRQDLRDTLKKGLDEADVPEAASRTSAVDKNNNADSEEAPPTDSGAVDDSPFAEPEDPYQSDGDVPHAPVSNPAGKDPAEEPPQTASLRNSAAKTVEKGPDRHG